MPTPTVDEALALLDPLAEVPPLRPQLRRLADHARELHTIRSWLRRREHPEDRPAAQARARGLEEVLADALAPHVSSAAARRRTVAALGVVGAAVEDAGDRSSELTNRLTELAAELAVAGAAPGLRGEVEASARECRVLERLAEQLEAAAAPVPPVATGADPADLAAALDVLEPIEAQLPAGTDWEDLTDEVHLAHVVPRQGRSVSPAVARVLRLAAPGERDRVVAALAVLARHLGALEEADNALGVELAQRVVDVAGGGVRSGPLPLRETIARGERAVAALRAAIDDLRERWAGRVDRAPAGALVVVAGEGEGAGVSLAHLGEEELEALGVAVERERAARGGSAQVRGRRARTA